MLPQAIIAIILEIVRSLLDIFAKHQDEVIKSTTTTAGNGQKPSV